MGLLVWLYDYDFLLNAGGPETPISDCIRVFTHYFIRFDHYGSGGWYVYEFSPLALLMIVGTVTGYVIHVLVRRMKNRTTA